MDEKEQIRLLQQKLAEERAKADELRRFLDRLFPPRRRGYADPDRLMTRRQDRG